MIKIVLKTVLWGVASWIALSVILFFGVGFYQGFIARNANIELPPAIISGLRYAVLLLSLGIAASIFLSEEKKQQPFKHIIAEEPKPKEKSEPTTPEKELKPEFHGTFMPKIMEKEEDKKPAGIIWPEEKPKEQQEPPAPPLPAPQIPPQIPPQPRPPEISQSQPPPWNRT